MGSINWKIVQKQLSKQSSLSFWLQVIVTIVLFLFAIRLLGSATDSLSPFLRQNLRQIIESDGSALGVSWVASYIIANGSIVAVLSLSLFNAELIVPTQLFLMIVGSRLGGAAVVIFIGAFDYMNEEIESLRDSVSLGLLTFLLTHSIYMPVLLLGYVSMPLIRKTGASNHGLPDLTTHIPDVFSIVTDGIIESFGPGIAFLLAIGLILLSLRLFDRILDSVDKQRLRQRYLSRLNDKWTSFGLGLVITGFTTSVAFSLGVIVPLYNRGHIKRHEIIPYVLGANIGTLVDTLIVAVALNTPVGVMTVVLLLVISFLITLLSLVLYVPYTSIINMMQNEIVGTTGYFIGFLISLLAVPLLLIII